jgi:hypothetical protein
LMFGFDSLSIFKKKSIDVLRKKIISISLINVDCFDLGFV